MAKFLRSQLFAGEIDINEAKKLVTVMTRVVPLRSGQPGGFAAHVLVAFSLSSWNLHCHRLRGVVYAPFQSDKAVRYPSKGNIHVSMLNFLSEESFKFTIFTKEAWTLATELMTDQGGHLSSSSHSSNFFVEGGFLCFDFSFACCLLCERFTDPSSGLEVEVASVPGEDAFNTANQCHGYEYKFCATGAYMNSLMLGAIGLILLVIVKEVAEQGIDKVTASRCSTARPFLK